mgnify:CR=1 FL=1
MPSDILVLMTDQHRADWVGAYGAAQVRTPTLDALASEGVCFTNCITSSPLCMPARASFLTGMYPHNTGMWDNVGQVRDTESTYLHPLRAQGYRTCHVGKSHLHPHGFQRDIRDAEPYMHALGWDDVLECTGPLSTQTTYSMLTDWMKEQGIYQTFLDDYRRRAEARFGLWPSPLPDGKHADDFMANTAIDYIDRSDPSQPLFLFLGLGGPHNPWDPPERFDTFDPAQMPAPLAVDPAPEWLEGPAFACHQDMMRHNPDVTPEQWAKVRALYSGRVRHVDHLMGRVLEAWYARRGRDCWVLFWSDHGDMLGDRNRVGKSVFYDASVRVPVILRPPGGCPAPVRCGGLVSTTDLTATLLDCAGCGKTPNVFGSSLIPAIEKPEAVGAPFALSEVLDRTMIADGRWKMVLNSKSELLMLFDTASDPGETLNLAGRPDTREVEARLREELLAFELRTHHRQFRGVNG